MLEFVGGRRHGGAAMAVPDERGDAADLFEQPDGDARLACAGYAHGDLSAFNLPHIARP
jgi:serine/threonine-protein kinase RIO1